MILKLVSQYAESKIVKSITDYNTKIPSNTIKIIIITTNLFRTLQNILLFFKYFLSFGIGIKLIWITVIK